MLALFLFISMFLGLITNKSAENTDDQIIKFSRNRLDRKINLIEFELHRMKISTEKIDSVTFKNNSL